MTIRPIRRSRRLGALGLAAALLGSSCSVGEPDKADAIKTLGGDVRPVESGLPEDAEPTRGGQLVYGIEADTDPTTGWCLSSSTLAISGMQVTRALYDTLTVPDAKGGYAPYLAKTITHSDDYRTWTITLRPGITFHNGSKLTATVVKNNLDAYRGQYEGRDSLLFSFVLRNIEDVEVVNELTLKVRAATPWVAFPGFLYSSGRLGIMAQAQLDASPQDCATEPIGTGPFSFGSWEHDVSLRVRRNAKYWQEAPDGKPYPYLDAIDFRPIANSDARLAALQQGDINIMHTGTAADMAGNLLQLRDDGAANVLISEESTEIGYMQLNNSRPPFDRRDARVAAAQSVDRKSLNEKANRGFPTLADGPFAPGVMGYLEDPGFPAYDPEAARKTVEKLKADGVPVDFTILTTTDPTTVRLAALVQESVREVGWEPRLEIVPQQQLINRAISGQFDMMAFRNQPGEDPDMNYVWWYSFDTPNPVNFAQFSDEVIDENLDRGRTTPDKATRKKAYEAINRRFAEQVYNVWAYYSPWAIAEAPDVHGILGPDLPGDGGPPPGRIVTGHSLLGLWIEQD